MRKAGRKKTDNPASYRYSVNFTAQENDKFLALFEQSGLQSKARFIVARVLNQEFRVVKVDKASMEYVAKLSSLNAQFRHVGVNYNQVVKQLNSNFTQKKAMALLYKLEKLTEELMQIAKQIVELSLELKNK